MIYNHMGETRVSVDDWIREFTPIKQDKPNVKVGIGLPMLFPFVHYKFVNSFLMLKKPVEHLTISMPGSITSLARNSIVDTALSHNCTHLLFLDTDMTFPIDTISRLLAHDVDIVGGLYFERYDPYRPAVFWKDSDGDYALKSTLPKDELVACDAIGTGCLLIKTSVFSKLAKPYFEYRLGSYGITKTEKFFSEDIVFSEACSAAGYNIFCDMSVKCGHLITDVEVDERFWNGTVNRPNEKKFNS
jgi:hypothetical protein